jgi:hypothetical protein
LALQRKRGDYLLVPGEQVQGQQSDHPSWLPVGEPRGCVQQAARNRGALGPF